MAASASGPSSCAASRSTRLSQRADRSARARPRSSASTSVPRSRPSTTPGCCTATSRRRTSCAKPAAASSSWTLAPARTSRGIQPPRWHTALSGARDLPRPEGVGPERRLQRRRHALLSRDGNISGRGRDDGAVGARARESPAATAPRPAAGRARGLHRRRRTGARQRSGATLSQRRRARAGPARVAGARRRPSDRLPSPSRRQAAPPVRCAVCRGRHGARPARRRAHAASTALDRLDAELDVGRGAGLGDARGGPALQRHLERPGGGLPGRRAHRSADLHARADPVAAGSVADLGAAVPRSAPSPSSRSASNCASTTSSKPRCSSFAAGRTATGSRAHQRPADCRRHRLADLGAAVRTIAGRHARAAGRGRPGHRRGHQRRADAGGAPPFEPGQADDA